MCKLSVKEYILLSVGWIARTIYTKPIIQRNRKYIVDNHDDYVIACDIVTKMSKMDSTFTKHDKFIMTRISDAGVLIEEIMRYEIANGIKWFTCDDHALLDLLKTTDMSFIRFIRFHLLTIWV